MTPTLSPNEWARLLGGEELPALEVAERLADARDLSVGAAQEAVYAALEDGPLVEDDETGGFGAVRLAAACDGETERQRDAEPDRQHDGETERQRDDEPQAPTVETWADAGFDALEAETWPPAHRDVDAWMLRNESKAPWSPWADPDAPVECARPHEDRDNDSATCAECGHSARYKWGSDGSREHVHADYETALEWREKHPDANGDLVFIQREADPFAFVDGDDVRDPETGDVHPEFLRILDALGLSYADVSTSGGGAHVMYRGELPDGVKQAVFEIDDEPFGSHDEGDRPTVEIYDGKHVCIATGDHVPGSGLQVREWDADALADVLDEYGELSDRKRPAEGYEAFNAGEYEPSATDADETTDDIRDIYAALDRLDARRVADRTIVDEWIDPSGVEDRAFVPTWAPAGYDGTANFVNRHAWTDSGERGGYGPPACMAAIDAGLVSDRNCPEAVRGETWVKAVDHLRDLGFPIPELEEDAADGEPEPTLPLARLDALDRDEARRYAKKHGVEWPTTREARRDLEDKIYQAMRAGQTAVLDAPTALGKSFTVATEPWLTRANITGEAPVVHLHETREARDQAVADSADANVTYARLLGRTEACPVAAGEHDPAEDDDEDDPEVVVTRNGLRASAWFENVCESRGLPFSVAHRFLDEHNDQGVDLPCCAEEGEQCPAIAQWDGLPWDDDGTPAVDVIHATHGFAHVPGLRNHTNLVFDERPDFRTDLGHERVREAVAAYLKDAGAPVTDFERFVARAREGEEAPNEHAEHQYIGDALEHDPGREWYMEADGAHTLAPALAKAIWYALRPDDGEEDAADANGRYAATVPHEPPRLDAEAKDDDGWNRTWVRVVLDEDNTVRTVRSSPDTTMARSVIGLDAHPTLYLWQQNVHPDIRPVPVLSPERRQLWRRFERGLTVVQVGDATRPLTSGEYFDEDGTEAFLRALRERYGDRFRTAITAAAVERETRDLLADVGAEDPETMHYGEEKSRGDFGDEDVGALNGCIDPGDGYVLDLLAEADLDARPETVEDDDGEMHRARGRGFVSPDAGAAEALLASVREQHVAQAAGRYARNADDPEDTAVVFVRTDATPTGFVDLQVPGVEWLPTERQREIVAELRARPSATARELAEATGNTKEHVRKTLKRLVDEGVVSCREEAGDHAAHVYRSVSGLGEGEVVDLETTNDHVLDSYTWSLAVYAPGPAQIKSVAATHTIDDHHKAVINRTDTSEPSG